MEQKYCPSCEAYKFLIEFNIDKNTLSGLSCYCRECNQVRCREKYNENPEKYRTAAKNWRFNYYQISEKEANWLLQIHQQGKCPICYEFVTLENSDIDHSHYCENQKEHYKRYGCKQCIRGIIHSVCNSRLLPLLERFPHLQADSIKEYLRSRPFKNL